MLVQRIMIECRTYEIDDEEFLDWLKKTDVEFSALDSMITKFLEQAGELSYILEYKKEDLKHRHLEIDEDTIQEIKIITDRKNITI